MANKRYDEFAATVPVAGNILLVEDTVLQTLGKFDVSYLLNNPDLIRLESDVIYIGNENYPVYVASPQITLEGELYGLFVTGFNVIYPDAHNFKHNSQNSFSAPANSTAAYTINFDTDFTSTEYSITCNLIATATVLNALVLKGIVYFDESKFRVLIQNTSNSAKTFVLSYQAIAYTP